MTVSTVPLSSAFFQAILSQLAGNSEGVRRRDLYELVADAMTLSPTQRAERLPSLTHLRYRHRIGWSMNLLKNAGLIESPLTGVWRLTASGTALLSAHPNRFSEETTRSIVRDARAAVRQEDQEPSADAVVETEASLQQPPEERIETAVEEVRSAVAAELLERIMQASPTFFETLVLDLLHAVGYGKSSDDLQRVGSSGDGGIDGVISLDKLGFEKVLVQAERWQGSVGRPELQGFFGALAGRRAKKGVFITTSTFTKDAQEFAVQVSDSIVIIDGSRLTELMIDHGVAVSHYRVIHLPRVDGEYFDS